MKLKSTFAMSILLAIGASAPAQLGNDRSKLPPEPADKVAARNRVNEAIDKAAALATSPGKLEEGIVALRNSLAKSKAFDKRYGGFSSKAARELARALIRAKRDAEAIDAFREGFRWDPIGKDLVQSGYFINDIADYALLLLNAGQTEEAKAMYYYAMRHWLHASDQYFPFLVVFEPDPMMTFWEYEPVKLCSAILMLRAINSGYSDGSDLRKERIEEVQKREPSWILPAFYANHGFAAGWLAQVAGMASDAHEKEWVAMYEQVLGLPVDEQQSAIREIWHKLGKVGAERRKNSEVLRQAKRDMERMHSRLAAPASGHEQD